MPVLWSGAEPTNSGSSEQNAWPERLPKRIATAGSMPCGAPLHQKGGHHDMANGVFRVWSVFGSKSVADCLLPVRRVSLRALQSKARTLGTDTLRSLAADDSIGAFLVDSALIAMIMAMLWLGWLWVCALD